MAINPTDPSGAAKLAGIQTEWPKQDTKKTKKDTTAQVDFNPALPPPVANVGSNQFSPTPMADKGSVSATNPGLRVSSTAMLPDGADVVLAKGGSSPVAGSFAAAVDHLDPDRPLDSLDATMFSVLDAYHKASDANPERVAALSRTVDEAFA